MSKYSNNFKLEVVKYYNEQHCGYDHQRGRQRHKCPYNQKNP